MRLLLDECVPRKLTHEFSDHEVRTVPQMGWAGLKNGELLAQAAQQFDVFITTDQNLEFQQDPSSFSLGFIVLVAPSNDIEVLRPLVPRALEAMVTAQPGQLVRILP